MRGLTRRFQDGAVLGALCVTALAVSFDATPAGAAPDPFVERRVRSTADHRPELVGRPGRALPSRVGDRPGDPAPHVRPVATIAPPDTRVRRGARSPRPSSRPPGRRQTRAPPEGSPYSRSLLLGRRHCRRRRPAAGQPSGPGADTDGDVAYWLSADGRITSLDAEFEVITGWSRADWIGQPLSRLIHPDDAGRASAIHREVLARARPSAFAARILSRTGEYAEAEFVAAPHREGGRPGGIAGVARLVRAPGRTARPGAPEGAALQIAVETGLPAIVCTDGEGRIVHFDRTAELIFRCQAGEVIGQPLAALVGEPSRDAIAQRLATFLAPGEGVRGITVGAVGRRRDGSEFPLEASLARWSTESGARVVAILLDATQRRLAQRALRRMNQTREDEARRIARELHDEAGQLLVSVHIALGDLAQGIPASSAGRLRRVLDLLDQIEVRLRDLSHELRPTVLDDLGLGPALELLARRVARRSGVRVSVEAAPAERLPPAIETTLYRVAQEALTNVARHARATSARVRLERQDRLVHCAITDDGIGFDVASVLARPGEHGSGLVGIRERVASLEGTVQIEAAPGAGTRLLVILPLED